MSTASLITTLVTPASTPLEETLINRAIQALEKAGGRIETIRFLAKDKACDLTAHNLTESAARNALKIKLVEFPCDFAVQQESSTRRKKLLISDMDSTIIEQECIDEMADLLGIKSKVAEITERAMRGELEFQSALRERVALLKGLAENTLHELFRTRITLSSGARTLVQTMRHHGATCVLVSGGFTFFTERVSQAAGFHHHEANHLECEEGQLTGHVREPILDKESKKAALLTWQEKIQCTNVETLALGDGANDIPMLINAGMGIAYHAKPKVNEAVSFHIQHTDLTSALFFQGYTEEDFIHEQH